MKSGTCFALFLAWGSVTLKALPDPEWKQDVATLERVCVKSVQPPTQILLGKLVVRAKEAQQDHDPAALAQHQAQLAQAQAGQDVMARGLMWHPERQEAGWEMFDREAAGKKWSLNGTQMVRQFRIDGCELIRGPTGCWSSWVLHPWLD